MYCFYKSRIYRLFIKLQEQDKGVLLLLNYDILKDITGNIVGKDNAGSGSARHGGDIYHNNVIYDFSVNTNPLGMSASVKRQLASCVDMFEKYPDIRCDRLRTEISHKENIPKENILCGNGASEIFKLVTEAVKPRKALVTAPAFSGYEYAVRAVGGEVFYYYLDEDNDFIVDTDITSRLDSLPEDPDIIFLCSPSNPVGRIIDKNILSEVLSYCENKRIYLVVDECFLGFTDNYETLSMKSEIKSNYLIVVNAFTKLYAMAGLRLGWCVSGNKKLLGRMERLKTEWSVSVPAQIAGISALKDDNYLKETRRYIKEERSKMSAWLTGMGIKVFPSDAGFLLIKSKINLYKELLGKKVLIRQCSNFMGLSGGFYRIAVRTAYENHELQKILGEILI